MAPDTAAGQECSRCGRAFPISHEAVPELGEVAWTYDPFLLEVHEERDEDWWCGECWGNRKDDV